MAIAIFLVALAYAGGRRGDTWAPTLFWIGQLMLFGAAVAPMSDRRQPRVARTAAVLGFAFGQYVIKNLYSPLRLKFPDELQHEAITNKILESGRLFPQSYSLPIGARYPGLEAVTAAVAQATGLSVHHAAVVVIAAAHLLLAAGVLIAARAVTDSDQLASAAALAYLCNPGNAFFNSMYLYQALALPLAVLLLVQAVAVIRGDRQSARLAVGVLLAVLVAVTHHLTAFVASGLLAAIIFIAMARRARRACVARLALLLVAQVGAIVFWIAVVAPDTVGYLEPPVRGLLSGSSTGESSAPSAAVPPAAERLATTGAAAVPLLVLPLLAWTACRNRRAEAAVLALGALALHGGVIAVRLFGAGGSEIAGRAQAFSWLATATAFAAAAGLLVSDVRATPRRRVGAAAAGVLIFMGGITSGWPPSWQRLPGRHLVAGFESAVDERALAVARWTAAYVTPGSRFAGDFGNLAVVGTLGNQFPLRAGSEIFYASKFRAADADLARSMHVEYLLVDLRLADQLPPAGFYFADDSIITHTRPVPFEALVKFRAMSDIGCVYDNGIIQIYELVGSRYGWTG